MHIPRHCQLIVEATCGWGSRCRQLAPCASHWSRSIVSSMADGSYERIWSASLTWRSGCDRPRPRTRSPGLFGATPEESEKSPRESLRMGPQIPERVRPGVWKESQRVGLSHLPFPGPGKPPRQGKLRKITGFLSFAPSPKIGRNYRKGVWKSLKVRF